MKVKPLVLFITASLLWSCASEHTAKQPTELRVYKLGNKGQVVIRAPLENGASVAEYTAVFDKEELRQFLGVDRLPLSKETMDLLDKNACKLGLGNKPFSIGINGAIDHTILDMENRQSEEGYYWNSLSPTARYGLLDKGFPKWLGKGRDISHDLFLPYKDRPFGMIVHCGYRFDNNQLQNCIVNRDVNKNISIQYLICSRLLKNIKEIDDIYFDFLERVVLTPRLTSDYRLKV